MRQSIKKIILMTLVSVLLVVSLGGCSGDGEVEKNHCYKCNGTGRIRDKYGYYDYVECTRCRGYGYLLY